MRIALSLLIACMALVPPAPPLDGGPKAKTRPTHPQWKPLTDPDD